MSAKSSTWSQSPGHSFMSGQTSSHMKHRDTAYGKRGGKEKQGEINTNSRGKIKTSYVYVCIPVYVYWYTYDFLLYLFLSSNVKTILHINFLLNMFSFIFNYINLSLCFFLINQLSINHSSNFVNNSKTFSGSNSNFHYNCDFTFINIISGFVFKYVFCFYSHLLNCILNIYCSLWDRVSPLSLDSSYMILCHHTWLCYFTASENETKWSISFSLLLVSGH